MMAPDDGFGAASASEAKSASAASSTGDPVRIVAAEAAGSGVLAFVIVAAGILGERYAIHNVGLALLITVLAGASAFLALTRTFGGFAPSLFNPGLALALAVTGRLRISIALLCGASQLAAACLGVMVAHLVTNTGLIQVATQIQTGPGVWTGELLGAVVFTAAMLVVASSSRDRLPLTAAASLMAIAFATPSTSFANPALTLARTLTNSFTAIRLSDAVLIAAVQFAGVLVAWLSYRWLYQTSR